MEIHAPSGARAPQKPTVAARSVAAPKNVALNASQPHVNPGTTPPR